MCKSRSRTELGQMLHSYIQSRGSTARYETSLVTYLRQQCVRKSYCYLDFERSEALPSSIFSCSTNAHELLVDAPRNEIEAMKSHLP